MAVGIFIGLTLASASAAGFEAVANRVPLNRDDEVTTEAKTLRRISRSFQEAIAACGTLLIAAGLARGDHGVAAGFATLPAITFVAAPLVHRTAKAREWEGVASITKKVHLVERNVAKVTNICLALFAARMVYGISEEMRMFSGLVGAIGAANAAPWVLRQVEADS